MNFGARLKELRQKAGFTQEELAQRLFVSRQSISNWENNKGQPDLENLILISELFETPLEELVKGKSAMRAIEVKQQLGKIFINLHATWSVCGLVLQIIFGTSLNNRFSFLILYLFGSAIIQGFYLKKSKRLQNLITQGEDPYDLGVILLGFILVGMIFVILLPDSLKG